MTLRVRRVVTGHDANGEAVVASDERLTAVPRRIGGNITGCEIWSTDCMPVDNSRVSEAAQRASTTEALPSRSSLIRLAGVFAWSMAAGLVTDEALSSTESCMRSLGSRTRKTIVSTIFLGSTLKEYCTLLNNACIENSRRMRT